MALFVIVKAGNLRSILDLLFLLALYTFSSVAFRFDGRNKATFLDLFLKLFYLL